jgi:hypothetical protein
MNTDDLAPLFESRETRLGRLPEEARARLQTAAESARESGTTDFEDQQFVSLWLSRRTGLPRKDVLANFGNIAGRYFGPGVTAAGAYDRIASSYKDTGTKAPVTETENPEAFAGTEGMAKVGRGALLVNTEQSARAAYGGFTGFSQKIPAGIYSQAATALNAPLNVAVLKDPMEDPEYRALRRQNEGILEPYKFTEVYGEAMSFGGYPTQEEEALIAENEKKMAAIRQRLDTYNRAAVKEWKDNTTMGQVSDEYRRLSEFWYELSGEAMERAGVNPEFQRTILGQFMQSAGSIPATAALAALGPAGGVGLESAFFADVEGERREKEGKAYDPQKAFVANLASAGPQMVLERAFGVERLMASVLTDLPKTGGKVLFGDFAKQFVKRGLTAGVEEGITEPAQNFWNDFIASQSYDKQRELLSPEAAKQRLIESVSAFTLGFFFAGGITSLETVDTNRAVAKGERYLTTKEGQVLTSADFAVLRQVKSDEALMATAPDEATGRVLVAAANGDVNAQQAYNSRVLAEKFVDVDGLEVDGLRLGMVDGVPAVTDVTDGSVSVLDMTNPEARAFFDGLKVRAVKEQATKETLAGLQQRFGESLKVERPAMPETLADRVRSGAITEAQANQALEVAKLVNGLAREVTLETAAIQGSADIAEVRDGVFQMVAKVAQAADPTVAIEEVSESYIKRAYAEQKLRPEELNAVREKWHADNGEADVGKGLEGDALARANIEWFSKRVVDYALARRKTDLPGGWGKWLRALGERLKAVLRGAARMKKLLREGKLDADLETLMKGALGEVTPQQVRAKLDASAADKVRAARQAELDEAFRAQDPQGQRAEEHVLRSYKGYEDLKAQLRAEEQAAALAALRVDREAEVKAERERDFIRAKLEEELQAVIENRLSGEETITERGPLTDEEVFVAEMLNDAPVYDLEVQLTPQAEALLRKYEGETEETLTEEARTLNASYRRAARGNREAMPTLDELGEEAFGVVAEAEDFPSITPAEGGKFSIKDPDGKEIDVANSFEEAQALAMDWYEKLWREEERQQVINDIGWGDYDELQNAIIRAGGLLAPSKEPVFKGELRALMENLNAAQRLRLFRKDGAPLDSLRNSLKADDGFSFDTISDLIDALERSTRGEPVYPNRNYETYNLTETPAFKAWFKNSKVVDEDGKPLVVYHGTALESYKWDEQGRRVPTDFPFTAFSKDKLGTRTDEGYLGRGFYFTDQPRTASWYAGMTSNEGDEAIAKQKEGTAWALNKSKGRAIGRFFVSLQNPLVVKQSADSSGAFDKRRDAQAALGIDRDAMADVDYLSFKLKDAGHDGVIYRFESGGVEIVAFEPGQIKSVTGNRGTFDPHNPDITFNIAEVNPIESMRDGETGLELGAGKPVTFRYQRTPKKAGDYGARFGQDIEPAGRYMLMIGEETAKRPAEGMERGTASFTNPIVLPWVGYGEDGWKARLSRAFGGKTGLALSRALRAAGYDGIITVSEVRGEPYASEVVDLTVIKGPTFNLAPVDGKLMALHNTSAEGLRWAKKLGGFSVPSIGVVKAGDVYSAFGDITLIADPRIVDPTREPVYNADAYAPRFPRAEYGKMKVKDADKLVKLIRPFVDRFSDLRSRGGAISQMWDDMVNNPKPEQLLRRARLSLGVQAAFLADKGINIDPVMRPAAVEWGFVRAPSFQAYLAAGGGYRINTDNEAEWDAFSQAVLQAVDEHAAEQSGGDEDIAKRLVRSFRQTWTDPESNNRLLLGAEGSLIRSIEAMGKMDVDHRLTREVLEVALKGREAEFKAWLEEKIMPAFGEPFIRLGRKKVPFTLENIVEAMSGTVVNKERTMTFGEGNVRAAMSRRFGSVEEMRNSAFALAPEEDVEKAREKTKALTEDFRLKVVEFFNGRDWKGNVDTWEAMDAAMRALGRVMKSGSTEAGIKAALRAEDFSTSAIPSDVLKLGLEAGRAVLNAPVPYFEAKPQRAVYLHEFLGAVIPKETPADVRKILTDAGVPIAEYAGEQGDAQARRDAVTAFMASSFNLTPTSEITFATTGIPQNQAQANQAALMRIQAKRLAAGARLLQQLNSGQPLPARAKAVRKSTEASLAAKLFVPLVTRLDAISKRAALGQRLRRLDFDVNQAIRRDFEAVKPFIEGFANLSERDAEVLDLALKNGDVPTRDAVLRANNLTTAFARVEQVLASTRARAIAAGYDVGEIKNYFPRKVNDVDGLMVHYYGQPQSGRIEQALQEAAKKAAAQGRHLTHEEKIEVVNSVLRGFRRAESKPGNLKERRTDIVDPVAARFYADSAEALVTYVERLNQAIERRRFFGKFAIPVPAAPGAMSSQLALESSIGAYVEDLIATGEITRQQQAEVQSILESRFVQGVQSDFVRNFKSLAYITTMGHVTSAMTQVSDLAFSLYENGFFDTAVSAGRAVVRKSKITKAELGLDAIAEEFRDPGKLAKALDRTFKIVGIHYLDMVGKETLVNAKFRRMQREAAAGNLSPRSRAILARAFDARTAAQVEKDLAAGKKTEDTLFTVYSVLADYQPLTQSEYPEYYLRHPNGRIFYMLKSFTLKQFDAFRREAITKIVSGNAGQKVEGFRNLAHLAGLLFLIGVPVDWLKDFIMGRRPQLEDILFKLVGVNRWALWQFRERQNPIESAMMLVAPPAPFLVYPLQDATEAAKRIAEGEDIEPGNFETWRALPFIGSPIYWLLGGGKEKIEARELRERGGSSVR